MKKDSMIKKQEKELHKFKNALAHKEELIVHLDQQIIDIGNMQRKLNDFEHGQLELLIGLSGCIESGDYYAMKKILTQYGVKVQEVLEHRNGAPDVSNLVGPELMSIRHLMLSKAKQAIRCGLIFTLEVADKIDTIGMPSLDFIDIIGIWLNNAIEEAIHTEEKRVHVSLILDQDPDGLNILEVRVTNSCRSKTLNNPDLLNQQGMTTKGPDRGNGLRIVQDHLLKHDNIHICTRIINQKFTQLLEIVLNESNSKEFD